MKARQLATGILSYVPGMNRFILRRTGGTESARYCYAVWLRHLIMAYKNGMTSIPHIVAELGPGDSLGMGLAALLSGAELYYAFDVVKYANTEKNLKIFDELVGLYTRKSNIPTRNEFPMLSPEISDTRFPAHILSDEVLSAAISPRRIKRIRQSLENTNSAFSQIRYVVPWQNTNIVEKESVDFIVSQAVFEHVNDIETTYRAIYDYLKPGGIMSHQIDFKSHNTHKEWNGHWTYSPYQWSLIRGRRPFLINRAPHSQHIRTINKTGFEILFDDPVYRASHISRNDLAPQFQYFTDNDLCTSGAFIQARKPVRVEQIVKQAEGVPMATMSEIN